ncbi:MAG: RagB/SusD family nutrient uptake outer membrane protein [Dysgonamonadaceae bacterium]|nr:RagB/SusD family nutrient uptake outer membrane protein [Dysgonamonadaceae bacterium]
MKNTFFRYLIAITGLSLLFPACEDFLETKPLDKMVEEDYWKTRTDVQSVLLAAYKEMTSDDFMERIMIGGEFRSDNIRQDNSRTDQKLKDILDMAIQTDNDLLKWKTFYTVINYCNRVLNRASDIVDIDPDYTHGMLTVDLGEARALRAMVYFYLIRIYHDVPYIDFPYDDDNKPFSIPKTSGEIIVDHIIADLEQAEREVVVTQGWSSLINSQIRIKTKGRFTKNAVRALLADVYLWKASGLPEAERAPYYQKCIQACEAIEPSILNPEDKINYDELNGSELMLTSNTGGQTMGTLSWSYYNVFYRENSNESIFELQFDIVTGNGRVPHYYGRVGDAARILASPLLEAGAFDQTEDVRRHDSFAQTGAESGIYKVFKYVAEMRFSNNYTDYTYLTEAEVKAKNWIFYRLPDVFLMKAEALAELGGESNLSEALKQVNKVYERSNPTALPLNSINYSTQEQMRELVLQERRREFLFEGKRWFDLLRVARREGKSRDMVTKYIVPNAVLNSDVILTKLSVMDALYLPIHRDELLSNTELEQNPYYADSDSLLNRK